MTDTKRPAVGVVYLNGVKVAEISDIEYATKRPGAPVRVFLSGKELTAKCHVEYSVGYISKVDAVPIGDGLRQTPIQVTSVAVLPRLGRWRRFVRWLRRLTYVRTLLYVAVCSATLAMWLLVLFD